MDPSSETAARLSSALADRYRIERHLADGGMASVYLAHDLRNDRPVAIKVLENTGSAAAAERFLAEIRLTASLQHPNILPLFDSGRDGDLLYYVMPYVRGESLRARLDKERQLGINDAVHIAAGVAAGLQYAHKQGIIHRDIKPENILLTDGEPLIADFGLGLALAAAGPDRITTIGVAIGTPRYMSPEQATGAREIDARTDVYSLGAVAYEMLAGEPPFAGGSTQAIVARVIGEDPLPPSSLRRTIPREIEDAILRALEKSPADRWADAGQFASAVSHGIDSTPRKGPGATRGRRVSDDARRRGAYLGVGAMLGVLAVWAVMRPRAGGAPVAAPSRTAVTIPVQPDPRSPFGTVALSRDGRFIVHAGAQGAATRLFIRRLDALESTPIPGTENGISPFLSPDGTQLGFLRGSDIVSMTIGSAVRPSHADVRPSTSGIPAWTADGRIVFTMGNGALGVVRPDGSQLDTLTHVSTEAGEQHLSPQLLPDGKTVLFTVIKGPIVDAGISAVSLRDRSRTVVIGRGAITPHVAAGYLIYQRPGQTLEAVSFDPKTLTTRGTPFVLPDRASTSTAGVAHYFASADAILYQSATRSRLLEIDSTGQETSVGTDSGAFHNPRYSSTGDRILFDLYGAGPDASRDAWVYDRAAGTATRLTHFRDGHDPGWMPHDSSVAVRSLIADGAPLFVMRLDGSDPVPLPTPSNLNRSAIRGPPSWYPDGRRFVVAVAHGAGNQIWLVDPAASAASQLVPGDADAHSPAVSPDGSLLAYVSDETGRKEVYLRSLVTGDRVQLSTRGGQEPNWNARGDAVFYVEPVSGGVSRLLRVAVQGRPRPTVIDRRIVRRSFPYAPGAIHANYDVTEDGHRVVVVDNLPNPPIIALSNWRGALRSATAP